jgi:hypothetical protein
LTTTDGNCQERDKPSRPQTQSPHFSFSTFSICEESTFFHIRNDTTSFSTKEVMLSNWEFIIFIAKNLPQISIIKFGRHIRILWKILQKTLKIWYNEFKAKSKFLGNLNSN